jgi:hypothetical protein
LWAEGETLEEGKEAGLRSGLQDSSIPNPIKLKLNNNNFLNRFSSFPLKAY